MSYRSLRITTHRSAGLLALVALFSILLASPRFASAHAEPERSNPAAGSTIEKVPATLEIWFTEEVADGTTISVMGPKGAAADKGDTTLDLNDPDRKHVTISLASDQGEGTYTVMWTSVSAEDKDSDSGEFTFTVGKAAASPAASTAAAAATIAPTPMPTATPAQEGNFDSRGYGISVAVGIGVAVLLFGFWRLVRPKNAKFG